MQQLWYIYRADSRLAPSQRETLLQSNAVSHWLRANLESALINQTGTKPFVPWARGLLAKIVQLFLHIIQYILVCFIIVLWVANVLIPFLINSYINPFYASNRQYWVNSVAPGRCGSNFKNMIFELIMQNTCSSFGTHGKINLRWISQYLINEKSTLIQVMAWCPQASMRSSDHHMRAISHDDVIKWKHFPRYWPFVRGIHQSPVNSPQKGQWRGALMFSLICAWINGWVNNRGAGDLRCYCAH